LCIFCNPKQHHADGQEQQTSVRCKWLHCQLCRFMDWASERAQSGEAR
jgi:hypothetical protein